MSLVMVSNQKKMREMAVDLVLPTKGLILELGCSSGNFAKLLFDRGVKNYLGIDLLQSKIDKAKKNFPSLKFEALDICKNRALLKKAKTFVSFETLEHIGRKGDSQDCKILKSLNRGTKLIISVPNSPYRNEHKRWFEIDGWKERYSPFIDFDFELTIQHERKRTKRCFLFKGRRK